MSSIKHYIPILLLVVSFQARSQVLSLDSVLTIVEQNNPMLKEYDERIKAFNTYAGGAKSWMAPMVGAGTFMTPYPGQMIMEERDKGSFMVSFEQEIPNPAKLQANKNYLESKSSVERHARANRFNQLRAEAKTNYYLLLVNEKKVVTLRENLAILELMLKLAKLRLPYNQSTVADVYKTEARISEIENMLLMAEGEIAERSFRLKGLMNLDPKTEIQIDTTQRTRIQVEQIPLDTTALAGVRSDVKQIDQTIEVMILNQKLQRAQAKPDFRIRFDHMQPLGDMPTQFTAMAMVSIPIAPWSSRMYKSEIKGMQYDIEAMKRGREAILAEARSMIAGMSNQIQRMQQQLKNYETRLIPALKRNEEAVMAAYEENREKLPMVIDAWEALNMAQTDYLEKLQEYYLMIVAYEKELEK